MNRADIVVLALSAMTLLLTALVVGDKVQEELVASEALYIMIRKDSLERIITNPCRPNTIEYMGNYILCRRRADYEARERMKWASPFPMRPKS